MPVPAANIRVLRGGEREDGWEVAYTPGHASHHVSYRHADSGWVFAGDTAGVRMPPGRLLLAPTPPPEFDLEYWLASIDTLEAWEPQRLAITHFGDYGDVYEHLDRLREALVRWSELAGDDRSPRLRGGVARRAQRDARRARRGLVRAGDAARGPVARDRPLSEPAARDWRPELSIRMLPGT